MTRQSSSDPLLFLSEARSDVGLVRENNEDSAYAGPHLLVLADGMGGHSSGEVASAVAVHTFAAGPQATPEGFTRAANQTRRSLRAMSNADPTLETMGTTVVAIREHGSSFYVCHIGDSRLYTYRDGVLTQVTTDHTHVQQLVETGRITREQVSTHPYRAMLLKSLDDQPGGATPDLIPLSLHAGDRVLLCSDGLSDYVPEHVLAEILGTPDLGEAADALIAAALRAGTRDNITVIVADVATSGGGEDRFVGAAAEPLSLSDEAERALVEADPGFAGDTGGPQREEDALTRTTVLGRTPPASAEAGSGEPAADDPGAGETGAGETGAGEPAPDEPAPPPGGGSAQARAFPVAAVFAAGAVAVVGLAVWLLI